MAKHLLSICVISVLICVFLFPEPGSGRHDHRDEETSGSNPLAVGLGLDGARRRHHRRPYYRRYRYPYRRHYYRRGGDDIGSGSSESDESDEDDQPRRYAQGIRRRHPDACSLHRRRGGCPDQQARWYYNDYFGECRSFTYSGCGGNGNNFVSRENCENFCAGGRKSRLTSGDRDEDADGEYVRTSETRTETEIEE